MESIEIRLRFQRTKLHYWHQNSVVPLVPASNHAGLQSPHRCLPEPANSIQVSPCDWYSEESLKSLKDCATEAPSAVQDLAI